MEKKKTFIDKEIYDTAYRNEVVKKMMELHEQIILLDNIKGPQRIPYLKKIKYLREFFWDIDEYLYDNYDFTHFYDYLNDLLEEKKITRSINEKNATRKSKKEANPNN